MANCLLEENGKQKIECAENITSKLCLKYEEGIKWQTFLAYNTNISIFFN